MVDNFKNEMINLDKKKFDNIRKLYPKSVKNANAHSNFKSNQTFNKDNNYIKYLENSKNFLNVSNKMPLSASMSNLLAKSYNSDISNINLFKRRNSSNNKNIFTNAKLLLLPNINI